MAGGPERVPGYGSSWPDSLAQSDVSAIQALHHQAHRKSLRTRKWPEGHSMPSAAARITHQCTSVSSAISRVRRKASGSPSRRSVATSECSPTLSRITSPASQCRCTAASTATKACFECCGDHSRNHPLRYFSLRRIVTLSKNWTWRR
jgi:hypothetical protein